MTDRGVPNFEVFYRGVPVPNGIAFARTADENAAIGFKTGVNSVLDSWTNTTNTFSMEPPGMSDATREAFRKAVADARDKPDIDETPA